MAKGCHLCITLYVQEGCTVFIFIFFYFKCSLPRQHSNYNRLGAAFTLQAMACINFVRVDMDRYNVI